MKSWQFINGAGQVVPCAWCQRDQGVEPQAGEASHGICPAHAKAALAGIGVLIARDAEGMAQARMACQTAQEAAS